MPHKKKATKRVPRIPKAVQDLVSIDRNPRTEMAADGLTRHQADVLSDVVRRRVEPSGPFSMNKALTGLTTAAPGRETAAVLGRFVTDEQEAASDRQIAALNLGRLADRHAQRALIRALEVRQTGVRRQVIKALGTFGDPQALAALRALRPRHPGLVQQLALARSLITHRLGIEGDDLDFRSGVKREPGSDDEMIELSLGLFRPRTLKRERELFRGGSYGIEISEQLGLRLRAGLARWTVFTNNDLGGLRSFSRLSQRPWITALLARMDLRTKTSAVQYVVLTDPRPRSIAIMVMRTDGEHFYSGSLTRPGGLLSFDIRDIARRGTAPTNIRGRVSGRGVTLDVATPFGIRQNTREGEAIQA